MAKLKPSRVLPVNRLERLRSTSLNAAVTAGCCRIAGSESKLLGGSGMHEDETKAPRTSAEVSAERISAPMFKKSGIKRRKRRVAWRG